MRDLRGNWRSRDRGRMDVDVVGGNGRSGCCELLWVEEVVVGAGINIRDVAVDVVDDGFEGEGEVVLLVDYILFSSAEGIHRGADSP